MTATGSLLALLALGLPSPVSANAAARANSVPQALRVHGRQAFRQMPEILPAARPTRERLVAAAAAPTGGAWSSLGPQPITGLSTFGDSAGRVTALAANGSTVYAGAADGGVWKSTDSGAHWAPLTDGQATLAIGALAVDWSTTPETVYAGTGEANHCQDCLPSQGVLKSADGGTTWTLLGQSTFTASSYFFERLTVDHPVPATPARVLAATNHGLYLSTDAGVTWTVVLAGETDEVIQDPFTPARFWATQADHHCATTSGPLRGSLAVSNDSGATWTTNTVFSGLPEAVRIGLGVGADATNDSVYVAIAACPSAGVPSYSLGQLAAVERQTNGAWQLIATPSGTPSVVPDYFAIGNPPVGYQGWYDNVIAVDPSNTNHAVFGGVTMLTTTDGGSTFTDVARPYSGGPLHPDFHAVAFTGTGSFYAGNDGGVYRTGNFGGTGLAGDWLNLNATLSITQFYHGSSLDLGHLTGGSQDNGTAAIVPGGAGQPVWESLLDGDGGSTAMVPNSTTSYAEAGSLDMFQVDISTFKQTEVAPCPAPFNDPSCQDPTAFIGPFVRDPSSGNGSERIYAATNRVYRTVTGGLPAGGTTSAGAWTIGSPDVTKGIVNTTNGPVKDFVSTMATGAGVTSSTVLTGTWFGVVSMTRDGQAVPTASWIDISGNLPGFLEANFTGNSWVTSVAVNPTNDSEAWVTISTLSGARVFHTINAGASPTTWTDITGAIPNVVVDALTVDPLNPSSLYLGTDTGPLVCTSCGGSAPVPNWVPLGTGLPNVRVAQITLTRDASSLVAWTHGRGAWSLPRPFPTPQGRLNAGGWNFGSQRVGTTSPAISFALTNDGTAPLVISQIAVSGDFARVPDPNPNACGSVLAVNTSCPINVTFTPTTAGVRTGTLSVSDNAADSPQTASLSGTGVIGQWQPLGGILATGPDASSWGPNRVDVFIQGQDHQLWHQMFNGTTWSGWEPLGGIITADPSAVSWGTNRIDVFARGQDRQLWHRSFDGTNWSPWEPLGGILMGSPDAASWASGRLDVFIRGQDNQLWQKTFSNGGWGPWQPLGGIITTSPGAVSWAANRIDVVARGQDNQLWHRSFDTGAWSAWEPLGGILASGPDVSSQGRGSLDVFIEGQDRQLWEKSMRSGSWGAWQPLGGIISADPGAVSPNAGLTDVFARGQDRALWELQVSG